MEIQPAIRGPTEMKHIKHVKYVLPANKYINQLPNPWFGRKTMLRLKPDHIPDLHWKLVDTYHTTNIGQTEVKDNTIHDIAVKTLSCAGNISLNTETYTTLSRQEPLVCSILPIT